MSWVATVASVAVGVAFLVAGASKVAAGQNWNDQARGLGAPTLVIPVLPWIEILLGAALIVQVGQPVVAASALVLLLAFTTLVVRRLAQGRHPPCACFGAWSAKPIGPSTVLRNVVLIALALLALAA